MVKDTKILKSRREQEWLKNIVWLAYQEGTIFQKFKKREKCSKMVSEFGVRRSTISFKIAVAKLIDANI